MNTEQISQGVIGLGVVVGLGYTGLQSVLAKREARKAAVAAYPVSNGWGTKVHADLSRLVDGMDRLHVRMDESDRRQTTSERRADERHASTEGRLSDLAQQMQEVRAA